MIEWIVSSSVLIVAVLLLRLIFRDKISKRFQYTLWVLVVLRLLIPGAIAESAASLVNLLSPVTEKPVIQAASGALTPEASYDFAVQEILAEHDFPEEIYSALPETRQEALIQEYQPEIQQKLHSYEKACDTAQILKSIWLVGCALMAAFLLTSNLLFYYKLKRTRRKLTFSVSLPIYQSTAIETPCLFGLIGSSIYLPDTTIDEKAMAYILAHEQTHYRHLDHIWSAIRCVCLALHWYNPLVWVAAKTSRTDSELACDEGTLAKLGDGNRESYGRALIEMSCAKPSVQDYLLTATTMTGDRRSLYLRIQAIAKKPKFILAAVIAMTVVSLVVVGCTFTGAKSDSTDPTAETTQPAETATPIETTVPTTTAPPTTLPPETTPPTQPPYHEDIMAVPMIRMMGMLYVLDKETDSLVQQLPEGFVYLGPACEENDTLPRWDNFARFIPDRSEVYASLEETDYIYYDTGKGYQRLIRAALVENEVSKDDPDNTVPEDYILAFFSTLLRPDSQSPYSQAAGQDFSQPEGIDLYLFCYNGFPEWSHGVVPLTEEEKAFLAANGWGEEKPMSNAKRFPISAMDARLQKYLGIAFWDTWGVGLDRMENYRHENQCYYAWRSDARGSWATISSVERENDTYHITYTLEDYTGNTYRMTLIKTERLFQIYSNIIVK